MSLLLVSKNYKRQFVITGIIVVVTIIGLTFAGNYGIKSYENSLEHPLDCAVNSDDGRTLVNVEKGECYSDSVQRITEGDTIKTKSGNSIRLSLVSAPELDEQGGVKSREFVRESCPINSQIFIDEDDGQLQGSYGRMIAKIYCGYSDKSVNELVLENNHGTIYKKFCGISEFGKEDWAVKYGC